MNILKNKEIREDDIKFTVAQISNVYSDSDVRGMYGDKTTFIKSFLTNRAILMY